MQVIKRDGQVADFDPDKIYQAILKAAQTVYVLTGRFAPKPSSSDKKSCFRFGRSKSRACNHQHDPING